MATYYWTDVVKPGNNYQPGSDAYKFYEALGPAGKAELEKSSYAKGTLGATLNAVGGLDKALSDPAVIIYGSAVPGSVSSPYSYAAWEAAHPRGGSFKDFLKSATGIALMAFPGIGQAIGGAITGALGITAAGAGVTAASMTAINTAVGNVLVNTALNGGDVKKAVQSAAAAYLGSKAGEVVGQQAAQFTSNTDSIKFLSNVGSAVTKATLLGQDVDKAVLGAAAQAATDLATKNIPGFSSLPAATRSAISGSINASVQGKNVNLSNVFETAAKEGFLEYGLSQIDDYAKLRPEQQQIIRNGVSKTLDGGNLSEEFLQGAISFGREAVQNEINNDKAKEAGWTDYATQQAAKSMYGDKVTPELYADKQETTEAEAKDIARSILGREPSEFEYMQLIGLPEGEAAQNSDLSAIRYDESTFDSNELAEAYKAVYGKEPTNEWLSENTDLLGRSEAQGKNMLQNLYIQDKNWVTEDEAAQFWKDMGNTGPAPQEFLDAMLMTTENGAKAMAETHRITSEDRQATTFDGSGYDTAEQARAAAIGAGFNAFTDPETGQTRIILPEDESSKRAQLARQVLDAQGLTPATATAEQRQQAMSLVGSVAQDKLDSTNVVDLMADAGIAGGSYVKQESNLKYYLTAPPAASAPKSFDGTKYSTQTDAAIAAASRGQNTFAWTDGKTYKVPPQIAEDGKSGALRDKAFAGDLVSLADAYARGEISNKEYKFLEAGVKKQTEAVDKLVTNRDLKSAQEAAGQTVGWANLGVETKETISMLDRAVDRVLSLGEGAGNLVASLGQTLAAATVWQQGEGDYTTGFVEGVPKQYMDVNGNLLTTAGNDFSGFFSSRYSDQAKTERKKITDEIKRPGATEASVAAVVLNNLHGYSTFTGAELAEEVIPFLAGGGIGAALKLGKAGLVAITGSAATIADMSEVYGPTYARVQKEALKQGDDEATAHAKASQAASGNVLITLATEGPLNFMLAKGLLVGAVKNAAYSVGGNMAAQMAGEYIESMAHNINEDYVLTGKTPVLEDLNKYRGQATFEALVAGGTTSGMYVLAAANPNKVIGKDYDGNDFTVADAITKPDQFDAKTLDSSALVTDPTTGKTGSFLDVFGDATTKYADGYSTAITESVISKNPTQSLEIMQGMGLADWGPNGEITFSPEAGDIATAFISSNTVLPQSNGTYAPTFDASSLPGVTTTVTPPAVTPPAVAPSVTPEQVEQIVSDALAENPSLTETQVREIVSDAVSNIPAGITPDTVANIVRDEVATATGNLATKQDVQDAIASIKIPAGLTKTDVSNAISEYMKVNPNVTAADVAGAISEYMTANPGLTKTDLDNAVTAATKDFATTQDIESAIAGIQFPAGLSKEDVKFAIADYMAANPGLSLSDVASKITDATSGLATSEGVATAIGDALKGYATTQDIKDAIAGIKFPAGISKEDVAAEIKAAMEANPGLSAADVTKSITDYMTANPGLTATDLNTAISDATKDLASAAQLTNLQNSLADEIQAAKDIGLEGDAAIQAGLDSLAEKVGTNQVDLLTQLGTTAADLKTQFATDIAASRAATAQEIANTKTALETAIADAKASGLEGDAALKAAIDAVAADQQTSATDLLTKLGTTEANLKTEFEAGLAGVTSDIEATRTALQDAIKAAQDIGLEGDAALKAAIDSVAAAQETSAADLLAKLGTTEETLRSDMEAGLAGVTASIADTKTALEAAIADAKASGLEGDAALKSAIDAVAADQKTNAAGLLEKLGTTEAGLKAEFESGLAGVSAEVADTRKALEDAIQAAKDIGLEGDAALQAGIDSVASELGTTKEALLGKLGTTEETLRTEFATGITGLETQMKAQYDALTAAQKAEADARLAQGQTLEQAIAAAQAATAGQISGLEAQTKAQYESLTAAQKAAADALVAQGQTLADAISAAKTEAAGQIADVETRLTDAIAAAEAMGLTRDQAITAAVESVAADLGTTKDALLTQLGKTEAGLRTEFTTGLAGVSAEVKAAYDSLTADQKALANQLAQQGTDLATAIQTAKQETAGQIGALSADMQAKYNSLSAEQKALATDMAQQGMDLTAAINLAQQQTQAQITGLGEQVDTRINELMQQGQSYQQATQQAIGELNQQNKQLQGLVGTQGRQATQADIDALSQMLGGQRSMDLSYDVTGDKQITQDDIDFLTQVVGGVKTDWTAPVGSAFGPTGLYGQLAANEAQRQADLQAQLAREEAARQASAEAARQANIQNLRTQGQQGLQSVMGQLQAVQAAGMAPRPVQVVEAGPGFDISDALNTGFFSGVQAKKAQQNQPQPTKIASGGYIDDLLAEGMSVDDLMNLLR